MPLQIGETRNKNVRDHAARKDTAAKIRRSNRWYTSRRIRRRWVQRKDKPGEYKYFVLCEV